MKKSAKQTKTRRNRDPDGLTDRQRAFVDEYLIDHNGTRAAIRAGYSVKGADAQASELLVNVKVAEALERARAERARRIGISADRVLEEVAFIAFQNAGDFLDIGKDGLPKLNLKKRSAKGQTRLIKKITQETWAERTGVDERGKPIYEPVKEVSVEFYAKDAALRDLVEHLGLKPPREVILQKKVNETIDALLERLQQNLSPEEFGKVLEVYQSQSLEDTGEPES